MFLFFFLIFWVLHWFLLFLRALAGLYVGIPAFGGARGEGGRTDARTVGRINALRRRLGALYVRIPAFGGARGAGRTDARTVVFLLCFANFLNFHVFLGVTAIFTFSLICQVLRPSFCQTCSASVAEFFGQG